MPALRILITGGSGLLGQYLNKALSQKYEILTCWNKHQGNCTDYPNLRLDLTNNDKITGTVREFQPDVIVHAAAFASPILPPEISTAYVNQVNVTATALLAKLAQEQVARMIYTSTDLVYAGYRGSMLTESAKLVPLSLYAETKLIGEGKVARECENHVILRTSLMYGIGLNHAVSHFTGMVKALREGNPIKLFTDQIRTPLSYPDAARMIGEIIERSEISGIYNFGGKDRLSRFEMGEILCKLGGFDTSLLIPSSCRDIPNYPAVEDVSLNTDKLGESGIYANSYEHEVKTLLGNFSA
ncbi:MAG: hypothetical protein AMXMBFR48_24360 [Ignavibacteriales bacterium]